MSKIGLWAIAAVFLVTMLYLVFAAATFEPPQGTTTVVLQPSPVEPETAPRQAQPNPAQPTDDTGSAGGSGDASAPRELPQTIFRQQPTPPTVAATDEVVEVAPPPEEVELPQPSAPAQSNNSTVDLPTLNRSDSFVKDTLRGLQNGVAVLQLLADDQLIRKFVVFVENVSRMEMPQTGLPYQSVGEEMPVRNLDQNLFVMEDAAYRRFDGVIDTFVAIDTEAALSIYRLLSPLFQRAYAEIGFRDVSFDDTLRRAVNNVLRAEQMEGPFQLVKPSVMYLFADASLENLSTVEKQLIRIGPQNSAKLKAKLRDFISQL